MSSKTKTAGLGTILAEYADKEETVAEAPVQEAIVEPLEKAAATSANDEAPKQKEKKKVKPIGINFRMLRADWEKLKSVSMADRKSMQQLIEEGLNLLMKEKGLPPLTGVPRNEREKEEE